MKTSLLLTITCLTLGGALSASTFTDNFEAATLDPFWTVSGVGSATLTSAEAYGGNQSVLLAVSPDYPWDIELSHDFGSDQVGSVSVFTELGPGQTNSAASIELHDDTGNSIAVLQRIAEGGYVAREDAGPEEIDQAYTGPTTGAWDELQIELTAAGVAFSVNGNVFFTDTQIHSFRSVSLDEWGGPSGSQYFDNFSETTGMATPEPSGFALAGLGVAGLFLALFRRKNEV